MNTNRQYYNHPYITFCIFHGLMIQSCIIMTPRHSLSYKVRSEQGEGHSNRIEYNSKVLYKKIIFFKSNLMRYGNILHSLMRKDLKVMDEDVSK